MDSPLRKFSGIILDLDGVVYRGNTPVKGVPDAINKAIRDGKEVFFLTNLSARTRRQYAIKLRRMGVEASENQIYSSAYGAASYITSIKRNPRVFVVGEDGLKKELMKAGAVMCKEKTDFVVVGLDRKLTYEKLRIAMGEIRRGARFVATNTDPTYPIENGLIPGAGAVVSAVETCAGMKPELIAGKPNTFLINLIIKKSGLKKSECIMVGDRIGSDVIAGKRAGISTMLVFSGIDTRDALHKSKIKPDYVAERVYY
ncbi:MAG: HAD-IIA family hydrolase [Candidatus Micrarchaeia archaeon]